MRTRPSLILPPVDRASSMGRLVTHRPSGWTSRQIAAACASEVPTNGRPVGRYIYFNLDPSAAVVVPFGGTKCVTSLGQVAVISNVVPLRA